MCQHCTKVLWYLAPSSLNNDTTKWLFLPFETNAQAKRVSPSLEKKSKTRGKKLTILRCNEGKEKGQGGHQKLASKLRMASKLLVYGRWPKLSRIVDQRDRRNGERTRSRVHRQIARVTLLSPKPVVQVLKTSEAKTAVGKV